MTTARNTWLQEHPHAGRVIQRRIATLEDSPPCIVAVPKPGGDGTR